MRMVNICTTHALGVDVAIKIVERLFGEGAMRGTKAAIWSNIPPAQ